MNGTSFNADILAQHGTQNIKIPVGWTLLTQAYTKKAIVQYRYSA